MGIFVDYKWNPFNNLDNNPRTIVAATTNTLWVTSLTICNRKNTPMRVNLKKDRREGLMLENQCYASTLTNLVTTYDNGAAGVGATLTNNDDLVQFTIDGVTPVKNSRILVKNQSSTLQNAIYTLTTIGDNSTAWVLTRAIDFDSPSEIKNGDAVLVTNGTVNANTYWTQNSNITDVGVDPITFISNIPAITTFSFNEFEIAPYENKDLIKTVGVITLEFSVNPFFSDSLVCYSHGYTQIFDCDVFYTKLNELPMI